jgi:hypothetical protein
MKYPKMEWGRMEAVINKLGGENGVDRLLRGELVVSEREPKGKRSPKAKKLDTIIRVDRSVRPAYPDWSKVVMNPELENTGPAEYDLAKIEQWLHDGQKGERYMRGQAIYDHLKSNNLLDSCLGLTDGIAIQQKGIEVFRRFFSGKAVFLWRSVVRNDLGSLSVPCLYEDDGEVKLRWYWLDNYWGSNNPALRFAS